MSFFKNIPSYWQVFQRYSSLLLHLIERDIKVKYRRSALGIVWSLLSPLLMMLVMTAVFSYIFRFQIPNYPIYLLSGQLIFNNFNEATSGAMCSVIGASSFIRKVYIPKYIFPLEKVLFAFVNLFFSFIALVIVMLFTRQPVTPSILWFPVPLILLMFFELGCGMILASMVVFFRDVMHFYAIFITALTYLTPIIYPISILPARMQIIARFNPLYWYVDFFRQGVLYNSAPTSMHLVACTVCAIFAMVAGLIFFKATQDKFILYV